MKEMKKMKKMKMKLKMKEMPKHPVMKHSKEALKEAAHHMKMHGG